MLSDSLTSELTKLNFTFVINEYLYSVFIGLDNMFVCKGKSSFLVLAYEDFNSRKTFIRLYFSQAM